MEPLSNFIFAGGYTTVRHTAWRTLRNSKRMPHLSDRGKMLVRFSYKTTFRTATWTRSQVISSCNFKQRYGVRAPG